MNGAGSRNKGNAFERVVAALFSEAFGETLRRVPASGGLDIKADIYNPHDDTFPYFVECKNRKNLRFLHLYTKKPLFEFLTLAKEHAVNAYTSKKYGQEMTPIVVFKGGHFPEAMVLMFKDDFNQWIDKQWRVSGMDFTIRTGGYVFLSLVNFLKYCNKERLNGERR